jgi:hypothetical protein
MQVEDVARGLYYSSTGAVTLSTLQSLVRALPPAVEVVWLDAGCPPQRPPCALFIENDDGWLRCYLWYKDTLLAPAFGASDASLSKISEILDLSTSRVTYRTYNACARRKEDSITRAASFVAAVSKLENVFEAIEALPASGAKAMYRDNRLHPIECALAQTLQVQGVYLFL